MTGPLEYGDDTVAAKLSVEIPAKSVEDIHQLTRAVQMLRVELEASARAQGHFLSYLNELPSVAEKATQSQRSYTSQLERGSMIQGEIRKSAMGRVPSTAPHRYIDPFEGMVQGRGLGSRGLSASPEEVRQTLQEMDPLLVANMQSQRGHPATLKEINDLLDERERRLGGEGQGERQSRRKSEKKSPDWEDENKSREERLEGLKDDVLNEMNVAGGFGRGLRLGARGLGAIYGGSRVAGLMRGAGAAGLAIGGGLALNNMIQNTGEQYQELKNQGLVQGGGALEGISQNIQAYTMALSPFINLEQSRQIVQQGLTQGYHGKMFDTVTEMVAYNTKEMAMDISTSFATIRKQVVEGGQTMEGYRAQQEMTKQLAASSTTKSLPQLQQEIASVQGALTDLGVPGGVAGQIGQEMAMTFDGNVTLQDVVGKIEQGAVGSTDLMIAVGQYAEHNGVKFPRQWLPEDVPEILGDQYPHWIFEMLKKDAQRYKGQPVQFMKYLSYYGINLNRNQAKQLLAELLGSKSNPADEARKKNQETVGKTEDRGGILNPSTTIRGVEDVLEKIGGVLSPILNAKSLDDFKNIPTKIGENWDNSEGEHGRYSNPTLNQLMDTFGASQIEVLDENGNLIRLDTDNKEQMDKLGSGEYKWRKKGDTGSGYTLDQSGNITSDSYRQMQQDVKGQLQIELSPDAKRLLQTPNQIQLSPNQQKANQGWGDSSMNNPPPGESTPRGAWGGR